jgi:hypothetical protein
MVSYGVKIRLLIGVIDISKFVFVTVMTSYQLKYCMLQGTNLLV